MSGIDWALTAPGEHRTSGETNAPDNNGAEVERLRAALTRANSNMEEAERSLYLKINALEAENAELRARLDEEMPHPTSLKAAWAQVKADKARLAWFEEREALFVAAYDALAEHAGALNEGVNVTAYEAWLEQHPKPK